jgi:disulfide bond formation protein DsbB
MLKKLKKMYPHQTLMMFFILGLLIIAGSFTVEHVFGVRPCDMCLWQRYLAVAITVVAFIGTLFRGRIKKLFIATITLLAAASLSVGVWQSLSQIDPVRFPLPALCQAPETQAVELTTEQAKQASADLLADIKSDNTGYVDCSKPEDFFLYNYTGITLANVNVLLMTFVMLFSFYKLFFKPRKRFRKFKKNNKHHNNKGGNNQRRRYRGSGYNRANNRNNRRHHHSNSNHRRNNEQ